MAKMSRDERTVYSCYHTPSCSKINQRRVNTVNFNIHNSTEHEMMKASVALELMKQGKKVITEAERNLKDENGKRRIVDVVDLSTGTEFEIETDPLRAIRFINDSNVVIIPVGWKKNDVKWKELVEVKKK